MNKNIVFTATYNEVENISIFIDKVLSLPEQYDILIIDDNSPDGTSKIVEKISKVKKMLNLLLEKKKEA